MQRPAENYRPVMASLIAISDIIYSAFAESRAARGNRMRPGEGRGKEGGQGRRQQDRRRKQVKDGDRIDVPTVMELPGRCRHDFPRDSTPRSAFCTRRNTRAGVCTRDIFVIGYYSRLKISNTNRTVIFG
jgi:hypothetical protein